MGGFAGLVRRQRSKPLIAVDGLALAGRMELTLACAEGGSRQAGGRGRLRRFALGVGR